MTPSSDLMRYLVGVSFALIVFGACFYGIVLYEYNLDDLKTGALISLMTLAANFVFAEAVARGAARRAQQSFDQGLQTDPGTGKTIPVADDYVLEFRDGKHSVAPHLYDLMVNMDTYRMSLEEALHAVNNKLFSDHVEAKHSQFVARHFKENR